MSSIQHVLSLDDLDRPRIDALLATAERLRGQNALDLLRGKSIVNVFLSPSLRTRVSMELAARQLGAYCVTISEDAGLWKLEFQDGAVMRGDTVEHAKEAVGVLSRYADLLAVRAFASRKSWDADASEPVLRAFQRYSRVPVLNLESALYHPCQALADILTITRTTRGARPGKIVLSWADHPKCLPVAVPNSFALAMTQMGWNLTIARPPGYDLPPDVLRRCSDHARRYGGALEITDDRDAAFAGASFVYAKSWGRIDRYGQEPRELEERAQQSLSRWIVDSDIMRRTDSALFMHCLPVRRNVVVADTVIDGPRSIVLDQVENRLHAQKALLLDLLGATPSA